MKTFLRDVIDPKIKFSLVESNEVDGEFILAKVKGQFFVPDGESRNGRFYTRRLWEKVIGDKNVMERLEKRNMFGTVGHDAELDDKAVREGLVSHFMSKIYIDDKGQGIGEAFIMNTPVGKILNTMLRSGSGLYVSSRANGAVKNERYNGLPLVDEDVFELIGWDFVTDPGFLQANPKIAEALEKVQKTETEDKSNGDSMLEKHIAEKIINENNELKQKVAELTTENTQLTDTNKELYDEKIELSAEAQKVPELQEKVKAYEELGTPDEIEKALEVSEAEADELEKFKELGSVEEISESLKLANKMSATIKEEFGSISQIRTTLKVAERIQEQLGKFGTVKEIAHTLNSFKRIVEEQEVVNAEKDAQDLAVELGMDVEEVKALLAKHSVEDIKAMYSKLAEKFTKKVEPKKTAPVVENKNKDKLTKQNFGSLVLDEKKEDETVLGLSLIESLNKKF